MIKRTKLLVLTVLVLLLTGMTSLASIPLASMDSLNYNINGTGLMLREGDAFEGSGMIETRSSELLLISVNFDPVDISEYIDDGGLHFWMYIYDADTLTGDGQIELTSSGICDIEETNWSIYNIAYDNGWNEVFLPFYECSSDDLNYEAVNYFRMYNFVSDDNYIVIDGISIGNREDFPTLDEKKETAAETKPVTEGENADTDSDEAGDESDGVIEDRAEEKVVSETNNMIYIGVIVFSALIVIITLVVIFTRKYDKEAQDNKNNSDNDSNNKE